MLPMRSASVQGLHLVVFDIETARAELADRGVEVNEVFHDAGGVFHHAGLARSKASRLWLVCFF